MSSRIRTVLIVAAVALLLLLSAAAWLVNAYRDSIALEVANRVLGGSGVVVTDVAVQSIATDEIRFERIVAQLAGGSRLHIEGVALPVAVGGLRGSQLHVRRVTMTAAAQGSGPLPLAAGLRAYLDAPALVPGATLTIDELLLPELPAIRDLAWHADEINPTLQADVGDYTLFLTVTPGGDGDQRVSLRLLTQDDVEALMLHFEILPEGGDFRLQGTAALKLAALLPVLRAAGVVPGEIRELDAALSGTFASTLPADENLPVSVTAEIAGAAGLRLAYRPAGGDDIRVTVAESAPVAASFEYPSLAWSAGVESSRVLVDAPGLEALPITLRNSRCRSGIQCDMAVSAARNAVRFGDLSVERVAASADALHLASGEGGWHAKTARAVVTLQKPAFAGRRFVAPTIAAELDATGDTLAAQLRVSTPEGALAASAHLSMNLQDASGRLELTEAAYDFGRLSLSQFLSGWPYDWDIASGLWHAQGAISWHATRSGPAFDASAALAAESLAGRYGDVGFVGLDGKTTVSLAAGATASVAPAAIEVALVDIGFPIENLRCRLTPDLAAMAVDVDSVSMTTLGGEVQADPFHYAADAADNHIMLHAKGIQLPLIVRLADLETVEVSGSVSGDIPVTIRGKVIVIDNGRLENDPPGGTIRYGSGATGIVDDGSQLGIVTRTLRNFEYTALSSRVDYSEDGDLKLQMRLTGVNPDVDPTQPVILNLNVDNNVPQMLRSLQAARSIEDILEKKLVR